MTTHSPDTGIVERLDALVLSLPPHELDSVRFSLDGGLLIMEGRVASYEAKCRLENAARDAGFRVQNSLRVTPGIVQSVVQPPVGISWDFTR